MPAFDRTTSQGPAPARADGSHTGSAGVYLTDETFLYRIDGVLGSDLEEMVELEDCYLLDSYAFRSASCMRAGLES